MAANKVVVFGPTGAVGSSVARTAASLGAEVTLAMRDTSKTIPGLDPSEERSGSFTRVQADLTKPDTVAEAVKQSGAKHAFIYLVFGSPDNMRATIQALKDAGIELVVFLSSFSVVGDLDAIPQQDLIPYVHAQVELNLEAVFGREGFVSLRPASFASNQLQFKDGIAKGDVKVPFPTTKLDGIVPEDIGRVGGTILAKGIPEDGNRMIYLYGAQIISSRESVEIIAKVLGKDPKITDADEDEACRYFSEDMHYPPPLVEYMIRHAKDSANGGEGQVFGYELKPEDRNNVEKYGGQRATTFEEWVQQNKEKFLS